MTNPTNTPELIERADKYGRLESPHVQRFERRLAFLQKARPKDTPYVDRDGEWGIYGIARDAMLSIIEYEATIQTLREALELARATVGDLRKGFAPSVDPARWVEQLQAHIDQALTGGKS